MNQRVQSVLNLLSSHGPEREVSKSWLFRTGSRFDRRFRDTAKYTIEAEGDYSRITVDGGTFLWPRGNSTTGALQILSEILTPGHPHQYLYGHTLLRPDDVVLDIGACEGAFAAAVTGRCKRVIAIEPSRSMCSLMESLFKLRAEPAPQIVNCLLGQKSSLAWFVENAINPAASRISAEPVANSYEIPVMTLDEAVESMEEKPTFIKCDAEGAEPAIFSGGERFLREYRPRLAITTYHNDGDFAAMHKLLTSLGYNVEGKGFLYAHGVLRVQMIHGW